MNGQRSKKNKKIALVIFVVLFVPLSCLFARDEGKSAGEILPESKSWFRNYGDYLVFLTVQQASPRGYMLSVFSDATFFETAIGKRLRLSSLGDRFHWGIEFGLFTSLERYGAWNFKNLCVDGKYGIFGCFDLKPTIFLVEFAHYCSNFLQGVFDTASPIRYSQYFVYGHFYFPTRLKAIPGLKFAKPYLGAGYYIVQYPRSHHIPFDFGLELETKGVFSSSHGFHIGFHSTYTGMKNLVPTHSVTFSWGTLSEATINSLPFTIGLFYQWGRDARGQYYLEDRDLFGFRVNILY